MHRHLLTVLLVGFALGVPGAGAWSTAGAQGRWFEVYFSQVSADSATVQANPHSIDRILAQKLTQAQTSIDAAVHEIDSERLAKALIQAFNRGVQVRIVTEHDYADEPAIQDIQAAGIPVVTDAGRSGLMHNKFVVIDGRYVWTGSYNATNNDAYKNNNNAIWVDSPQLAANFTQEFLEMFQARQFGVSSPASLPHPVVAMPDGTRIFTYFAPENAVDTVLAAHLREARDSIVFLAFAFTHDGLGEIIRERFRAGVQIRGVFETRGANVSHSEYPHMRDAGLPVVQDTNPWSLHHKVMIIDGHTVVTGSFNFSRNAAQTNDENLLIVVGSREIARLYTEEFERLTGTTAAQPAQTAAPPKPTDLLPINTATQEEIERLPGIGPVIAQRIIAGRPYRTLADLERVPGLGPRKIEAMKGQITFR